MPKLRSLSPLVRTMDIRTIRPPQKRMEEIYGTPQFRAWRAQVVARAGNQCEAMVDGHRCDKAAPEHRMYADHRIELKEGGHPFDLNNGQCLCASHHTIKTFAAKKLRSDAWSGSFTYPALPKATCRVKLICGPPASGKSTFVRDNAKADDIVIDLDMIAREHGFGRDRSGSALPMLLRERNNRLAALAREPAERVAWVILGAPGQRLRRWWCETLGVQPDDCVLLLPTRTELHRRVVNDPDRQGVIDRHMLVIDKWLKQEIGAWPVEDYSSWGV